MPVLYRLQPSSLANLMTDVRALIEGEELLASSTLAEGQHHHGLPVLVTRGGKPSLGSVKTILLS